MIDFTAAQEAGIMNPDGVDPRAIPTVQISWTMAMRLRAVRLPAEDKLRSLCDTDEGFQALNTLADLTDARQRVLKGEVGHQTLEDATDKDNLYTGYFYQKPAWQFGDGQMPGLVVSETMAGALSHAVDAYSGFLKDGNADALTMHFILDRMKLRANLHDLTDMDAFGDLYQGEDHIKPQKTVRNLLAADSAGLLYGHAQTRHAVILKPELLTDVQTERAIALQWDGQRFTRLFDYRDLYWKDI